MKQNYITKNGAINMGNFPTISSNFVLSCGMPGSFHFLREIKDMQMLADEILNIVACN